MPQSRTIQDWKVMIHPLGFCGIPFFGGHMGMDQYLLIQFLGGWTSIYQLFWCSPRVQGFDTLPYFFHIPNILKHDWLGHFSLNSDEPLGFCGIQSPEDRCDKSIQSDLTQLLLIGGHRVRNSMSWTSIFCIFSAQKKQYFHTLRLWKFAFLPESQV